MVGVTARRREETRACSLASSCEPAQALRRSCVLSFHLPLTSFTIMPGLCFSFYKCFPLPLSEFTIETLSLSLSRFVALGVSHRHFSFLCSFGVRPSMAACGRHSSLVLVLLVFTTICSFGGAATPLIQNVDITGGGPIIRNGGNVVDLLLNQSSASGFKSKQDFLFARVDMQIKLPAGDSAGTVTTFYMSSQGTAHDEIDLEFLGNETGQPYVLHTNIYAQGKGNKEMQFYLWFDPTAAYHTYSILWNPRHIIFYVDRRPIRVFTNKQALGIPFPTNQTMKVYASLWNADDWATQGGRVKTNWTNAPFIASYTNFRATPCPSSSTSPLCGPQPTTSSSTSPSGVQVPEVDNWTKRMTRLLQKNFMIYNYCNDVNRFPQGLPQECLTEK